MKKKLLVIALAAAQLMSCAVYAAPYDKEEVVYVTLSSSGAREKLIVVNSVKTNGAASITDYGNYKNIKNLSSTKSPDVSGNTITWDTEGIDEFYYQGEKESGELPWNISIRYTLDGKPLSGEELIGKSGKASIEIDAQLNDKADSYYTDNYMAQLSFTLDSEKCSGIVCDDATIATVGSEKQLTIMILPKSSKTIKVAFDTKDFEMDGMTIAMLKLSDGIFGSTVDTASAAMSEVTDGISALLDGSGQLKNGAEDLADGVALLNTGAQGIKNSLPAFRSGMEEIGAGADSLDGGLSKLVSGSSEVRSGLSELDSRSSELASGISAIEGGLSQMTKNKRKVQSGLSELKKSKSALNELTSAGDELNSGYAALHDGIAEIADKKEEIQSGLSELHNSSTDISAISSGLDSLDSGLESIYSAMAQQEKLLTALYGMAAQNPALAEMAQYLAQANYIAGSVKSGAASAMSGVTQLSDGVSQAQDGINTLYSAADTFGNAALAMTDGAQQLEDASDQLNSGLSEYTDGAGSAGELYSSAEQFGNSALALIQGAEKLQGGAKQLREGFGAYSDGVGTLASEYMTLDNGIFSAHEGASALKYGALNAVSGADSLTSVTEELAENIDKLDNSTQGLPSSVSQLSDGVDTLYDGVSGVDIASMIAAGSNAKAVSFAAPNTAKPERVQFLEKTPDLHIEDAEKDAEEQPKKGFFQKLADLFRKK